MSNEYKIDITRPLVYGWTFDGTTFWHQLPPYHIEDIGRPSGYEWKVKVYNVDAGIVFWDEDVEGEQSEEDTTPGRWVAYDAGDSWVGSFESLREAVMCIALRFHNVCSPNEVFQRWPQNAPETGGPIT